MDRSSISFVLFAKIFFSLSTLFIVFLVLEYVMITYVICLNLYDGKGNNFLSLRVYLMVGWLDLNLIRNFSMVIFF